MSLQIIYGKSGTGKSEYCYNNIKEIINNKEKIYIITPEQFSFTAEKRLLDVIGTNTVINAEVISFNRMANRVFKEVGGATKTHITKSGRIMLIYDILTKQKKNLKFLSQAEKNLNIALNSITELKKHGVTIQDLENIKNEVEDEYLATKLEDISLLYNSFNESIKDKFLDENDTLDILAQKLYQSEEFKNSIIYIDEFIGFTAQEYSVIKTLLKISKKVVVCVAADVELETNITNLEVQDIFYQPKKAAKKIMDIAKELKVEIEKPIILKETKKFKTNELIHIEENICKTLYKQYNDSVQNIEIFLAMNPYSEIEKVAKNILKLVREENYSYNDISIIARNLENYSGIAKAVFSKYNIPVFIDEKNELNNNMLAKYILSILEVLQKNWSYESVFDCLKNPFSGFEKNEIYYLEKYCLKWGIRGNKWLSVWKYNDDNTEVLEIVRKKFVSSIETLKNNLNSKRDYTSISNALYEFLLTDNIEKKINKKLEELETNGLIELAEEYSVSLQAIIDILDEIVLIFKEEKTTFEKYKEILKIGLENINVGKIPATLDQIIFGDIERSKTHSVKAVFIIGLNDGVFPSMSKGEGFLNDKERDRLKKSGIELASGTTEQLYEEQLNIYKAFTTAEEKMFLSYSSSDKDGKALRQSMLINKLKKIFPKIEISSDIIKKDSEITVLNTTFDELLINLRQYQDGEEIDKIWFEIFNWYNQNQEWQEKLQNSLKGLEYSNLAEKIESQNLAKLYPSTLKTSVSRLEQYKRCPFSFHMKYGLKLKEDEKFEIRALDTGSFMHDVIDTFFERTKSSYENGSRTIKDIVNEIIDEKLQLPKNYIFSSTPKFINLTNRLKKVILQSIEYIVYQLNQSDFNIAGNEVEFSPIILELENKQRVEIIGKIDRIDLAVSNDKKYLRIIDYKSSIKNIDLNEVVNGLQIQLLTYLDSVTDNKEIIPAGVLYFNLIDPIIKNNKNLSDEEIQEQIRKQFKMNGLILADIKVIKMMDNKLEKGSSDIIPAYIKTDGTLSDTASVIKEEDFKNLQIQVKKIIKEISKEILKGSIDIKPYKKQKAICEYCEYKTICGFNTNIKGNDYFKIHEKSKNEILVEIKEKKEEEKN